MQSIPKGSIASQPELKVCGKCGIPQLTTRFRRRKKDANKRHSDCNKCHSNRVREWRKAKTDQQHRKALSAFSSSISRASADNEIRKLTAALIQQFGTVDNLAEAWAILLKDSVSSNRRGQGPLRSFEAIFKLMVYVNEHPQDFSELDLEQIREEKLKMVREAILENPWLAVHSVRQMGWEVIPPDDEL